MNKHDVMAALESGFMLRRELLRNKSAGFRLSYSRLRSGGEVVERGTGMKGDPVYSGLPGASVPPPRYVGGLKLGDVNLLIRSGKTEGEARQILEAAIASRGDNMAALVRVLDQARAIISDAGGDPWEMPMPHEKRKPGRPRKVRPFLSPLIPCQLQESED